MEFDFYIHLRMRRGVCLKSTNKFNLRTEFGHLKSFCGSPWYENLDLKG